MSAKSLKLRCLFSTLIHFDYLYDKKVGVEGKGTGEVESYSRYLTTHVIN